MLYSRENHPKGTVVKINKDVIFGGKKPVIIAGPCAIESESQFREVARAVKKAGADMLRGGAFKPRTSPYAFQGLGEKGLKIMRKVADEVGMPIVSECLSEEHLDLFKEYADMIQIGSRNMQNFDLLKKIAKLKKPILLKRGMSSTIEEFLLAAEYILNEGNPNIVLCERGIRTFDGASGNTLDLNGLILVKTLSHLPIIADPSHAAGMQDIVIPLARAALAAGANGLIIEVHNKPDKALSDGKQALTPESFAKLMTEIKHAN